MYAFMIVCSLITISVVSAFGRLTREAIAAESVSTMMLGDIPASARYTTARREGGAPVVDSFVQAEQHEVEVLQHAPLLYLVSEKHVHGIRERDECRVQHQLVLGWVADEVEDQVERVLIHRQM